MSEYVTYSDMKKVFEVCQLRRFIWQDNHVEGQFKSAEHTFDSLSTLKQVVLAINMLESGNSTYFRGH